MAGELERLLIRIEAETAQLRREMANADKSVSGFASNVDRHLSKSDRRFSSFEKATAAAFKRVAVAALATKAAMEAFSTVQVVGNINDSARAAALSTEKFQEYAFAARTAGVAQEDFAKQTEKFAVAMAGVRAHTGAPNSMLEKHLPSVLEQLRATKSQEEAYDVMANAIGRLGSEEERTALAQAAFGKTGGDLVEVLAKGAKGLDESAKKARELGVVLDQETTDSAERFKKKWEEVTASAGAMWDKLVLKALSYGETAIEALRIPGSGGLGQGFGARNPNAAPMPGGSDRFGFAGAGAQGLTIPDKAPLTFAKDTAAEEEKALRALEAAWRDVNSAAKSTIGDLLESDTATIQEKINALTEAVKNGELGWRDYLGGMKRVNDQSTQLMDDLLSTTTQTLDAVFQESKTAAIASALINTAQGVTKALATLPPPYSFATAALTAAQGFAQVAAIRSTNRNGGGGAAPSTASSAAGASVPAASAGGGQTLYIKGINANQMFSGSQMRELARQMIDFQKDGGKVVLGKG